MLATLRAHVWRIDPDTCPRVMLSLERARQELRAELALCRRYRRSHPDARFNQALYAFGARERLHAAYSLSNSERAV